MSRAQGPREGRGGNQRILYVVFALALVLRLWGLADRLPDPSQGISPLDDSVVEESDRTEVFRAWAMWEGGARPLTLDPGTVGWPSLSFYVTLLVQALYRLGWSAVNGVWEPAAFAAHFAKHPEALFLAGRIAGVVIGMLSIWAFHRVATLVTGGRVALIAALFLALNPLHVQASQHVCDPNLLALLFALLALPPLLRIPEDPTVRSTVAAAIWIGLAASCKYLPGILFALVPVQAFAVPRPSAPGKTPVAMIRCGVGLLAAAAAFAVTSPFVLLRGSAALAEIESQRAALTSEWVGQSAAAIALPDYLLKVLPSVLTWPIDLAAIAGLVIVWRRGGGARLLALAPMLLIGVHGILRVAQERYVLPAVPFLLLAASVSVAGAVDRWGAAAARGRSLALPLLVTALLLLPASRLLSYRAELSKPDSRREARRWILEHLPPGEPMAVELYGPVLNSGRVERAAVTWPFYSSHTAAVSIAYHWEFLHGIRYYVESGEVRGRLEADRARYPAEQAFYRWLDRNGAESWSSRRPDLSGPAIRVLRLPDAVSSGTERDSVWQAAARQAGIDSVRVARWCGGLATLHAALGRAALTEEWARRGSTLATADLRRYLLAMEAQAMLSQGKIADAGRVIDRLESR